MLTVPSHHPQLYIYVVINKLIQKWVAPWESCCPVQSLVSVLAPPETLCLPLYRMKGMLASIWLPQCLDLKLYIIAIDDRCWFLWLNDSLTISLMNILTNDRICKCTATRCGLAVSDQDNLVIKALSSDLSSFWQLTPVCNRSKYWGNCMDVCEKDMVGPQKSCWVREELINDVRWDRRERLVSITRSITSYNAILVFICRYDMMHVFVKEAYNDKAIWYVWWLCVAPDISNIAHGCQDY